jgi:hypothetical protein
MASRTFLLMLKLLKQSILMFLLLPIPLLIQIQSRYWTFMMTGFSNWLKSMLLSLGVTILPQFCLQKVISELTQMDGHLTTASPLTSTGKDLIQGCLHSKIMASQILAMLSDYARQVIERQSDEYSWTDKDGLDEEMDGMTILALIL